MQEQDEWYGMETKQENSGQNLESVAVPGVDEGES